MRKLLKTSLKGGFRNTLVPEKLKEKKTRKYKKEIVKLVTAENPNIKISSDCITSTNPETLPDFLAQALNQENIDNPILLPTMIKRGDPLILELVLPYIHEEDFPKLLDKKDLNGHRPLDLAVIQVIKAKSSELKKNAGQMFKILIDRWKSIDKEWMNSKLYTNKVYYVMEYLMINDPLNNHIKPINQNEISALYENEKNPLMCTLCHEVLCPKQNKSIVQVTCCNQYFHTLCLVSWYYKKEIRFPECFNCGELLNKINICLE